MVKKIGFHVLHSVYLAIGHLIAFMLGIFWSCRDALLPPKQDAVLFVSHPDDEVLFYHKFLKEKKPFVVCLTTAGLPNRIFPFFRVMKYYKLRYRCFDMSSRDINREYMIRKHIRQILSSGQFSICATHNKTGEYGHIMHKCVHKCVKEEWNGPIFSPICKEEITKYPLDFDNQAEKDKILRELYFKEYPTLSNMFSDWIKNEKVSME